MESTERDFEAGGRYGRMRLELLRLTTAPDLGHPASDQNSMALGIKPTVDFAFKNIFGSPENSVALIGLLNAILDLTKPITEVATYSKIPRHPIIASGCATRKTAAN